MQSTWHNLHSPTFDCINIDDNLGIMKNKLIKSVSRVRNLTKYL